MIKFTINCKIGQQTIFFTAKEIALYWNQFLPRKVQHYFMVTNPKIIQILGKVHLRDYMERSLEVKSLASITLNEREVFCCIYLSYLKGMGGGAKYTKFYESTRVRISMTLCFNKTNFPVWYCLSHGKYLKFQFKIKILSLTNMEVKTGTWCIFPPSNVQSTYCIICTYFCWLQFLYF